MTEPNIPILFYEGCLRNRKQLCAELSITDSRERTETEKAILRKGYERWDRDVVHHLYGGFSFALRVADGSLFCARDHFGLKSFYYCLMPDGRLCCSADISGITADPAYTKAIDPEALQLYMMFGYPVGEKTLWRGIRKLMPGCMLIWDTVSCKIERYYHPSFHPEYGLTEETWIDRFNGTLQDILDDDRACMSLSGGSAFLSGGVDSALLLAASGVRRAASIRFPEQAYSEWEAASETAAWLGRELQGITLSAEDFIAAIPRFVKHAELPLANPSAVAFMLGCEQAAGMGGPWLSGEGADEFFAGYHIYRRAQELALDEGPLHYGCDGVMEQVTAQRLLRQERAFPTDPLVRWMYEQTAGDEHLSRLLLIDIGLWLEGDILFSVNRSARANGIELLLPYADRRMFELSASIPAGLKLRGDCGKYILRRAAEKWLPHDIAFRKKIGFSVPAAQWLSHEAFRLSIEKALFGEISAAYFDRDMLERLWDHFLKGQKALWKNLYTVIVFVLWHECCFEPLRDEQEAQDNRRI